MSATHTPGPWGIEGLAKYAGRGKRGYIISHGVNEYGDGPKGYLCEAMVSEADARLMAAAPELLAALRAAHSALAMLTAPTEIRATSTQQAWAQCVAAEAGARAVIAKAESRGLRP